MRIEITTVSRNLEEIARRVGGYVQGDMIRLPPMIGEGYFRQFEFSSRMRMVLINCSFREAFSFVKSAPAFPEEERAVTLGFKNLFKKPAGPASMFPSVTVTTDELEMDVHFAPNVPIQCIFISVQISYLKELLQPDPQHSDTRLKNLLEKQEAFVFEEIMTAEIRQEIEAIEMAQQDSKPLTALFHRVKAERLIYLFLAEFLKRTASDHKALNSQDVQMIYRIRDMVMKDLSTVPYLPELAQQARMSESKLKLLFRQVFGQSIYQYYQHFRMQEAARLIREEHYAVSDAGYQLGFSNLSHFSRLFEKHLGMKPKQFSKL